MSADYGRRGGGVGGLGHTRPGQIVSPQPVSDKSIIDSVAGIINDIVPQAYASSSPNSDNRETISWARFEWADINDPSFFPEGCNEGSSIPPLLLVLGYASGAQLWLVTASGEATEVLSWRSGPVRCLRVLPTPSPRRRRDQQQQQQDPYRGKRPLVALCDASGPQPHYHAVSFVSLRTGETVRSIRFKSAVSEVLANKRTVLVTFPERIAVFDALTFDDILSVTTCYHNPAASPANVNPVALGSRWMAYCERRLLPAKRSSGGCEAEGVSSYTATVLYAAKSLGKGLRGLGETVASSLAGGHHHLNSANSGGMHAINSSGGATTAGSGGGEASQPGIVSVLDLEGADGNGELLAHFAAHSEAVVAMCFDQTGALLMTADRRGHDFHVFRLHPHPGGSSLAAVHHLYVLHRGDTSARVQDMTFSGDARWAVVSTSRGTSHVFPVAPYGGPLGVRTHSSPHVVNRLSRFQRSAGLGDDSAQRSHSPVASAAHCYEGCSSSVVSAATGGVNSSSPAGGSSSSPGFGVGVASASQPYGNPRLPPYPHPIVVHPLAQIRQPSSLGYAATQQLPGRLQSGRLSRHQSEDSSAVKLCACFAPPRAWICAQRDAATTSKLAKRAVDSLFIMACHGNLIQYDLEPKSSSGVPREKVCDDTPIELEVEAKGQWPLMRTTTSADINVPLSSDSPLLELPLTRSHDNDHDNNESRWLSQVEIFTHAGPHRRLWMGPQFVFKTYNAPSGVAANLVEAETVEVGTVSGSRPARSNPVNMPHAASRPLLPVVIDGSGSSYEQSPRFVDTYGDALDRYENASGSGCENQLREDLAEAMLETTTPHRSTGRRLVVERVGGPVAKVVNPLGTVVTVSSEEEEAAALALQQQQQSSAALATSTTSSASKSDSVCAEEGKWSGCGCAEELLDAEAVREHTEICAEMRPTPEVAAIDAVPPESIEEVREMRTLCAEFGKSEQTSVLEDCHAWSCPPSSSDEEGAKRVGLSSSENDAGGEEEEEDDDDGDIEHVLLLGEPEEQKPPQQQQQQTRRRSEPEDMPDMVEIIDIDAMQRALGEPEPTSESVRVVLAPPKPKPKRNKAQRVKQTPPPPTSCESPAEPRWSALLEANKENLREASEERAPAIVERSSSLDEANALLLLLPMDTEEENVLPADVELEKGVGETVPAPLPLLTTSLAASKKANRSKKKKRR